MRRIARMADGWMPQLLGPHHKCSHELLARFQGFCREYGRDPTTVGLEVRLEMSSGVGRYLGDEVAAWRTFGATHLTIGSVAANVLPATKFPNDNTRGPSSAPFTHPLLFQLVVLPVSSSGVGSRRLGR
jgi:hypothetical protein